MADRKIKIKPRDALRQQEEKEQKTPSVLPEHGPSDPASGRRAPWLDVGALVLIAAVLFWLFYPFGSDGQSEDKDFVETEEEGFDMSGYVNRVEFYASAGYEIYDIVEMLRVPQGNIQGILHAYREQRDVANLPESVYRIYTYQDNPRRDALLVIEPEPPLYQIALSLVEPIEAHVVDKHVDKRIQTTTVVLPEPSLGYALWKANIPPDMLAKIEQAFAWTIDLHHLKAGDKVEMIYEEYSSDGMALGIGRVYGFRFDTQGETYYAFNYKNGPESFFLDENALSMKKRFLKAPVKYSTITSHYGPRTHPIKEEVHVHRGTDFAAPRGTPILALADGIITTRSYTSGNGNYVKIRHDDVFDTQYLHLDRFEETLAPGSQVNQGDIIGFVGSTGLATGPHVCLRLWKEGQQVNFIEEEAMDAEPLRASALSGFLNYRDSLMNVLNEN